MVVRDVVIFLALDACARRHFSTRSSTRVTPPAAMPQENVMDRVKLMVGMEPSAEPELQEQIEDCFQLSRMERLYGFAICVTAGLFCSFLSSLVFLKPTKFAILYSLGNILSLTSTGFLMGFWSQLKNMFKSHRLLATLVYLAAMVATLVAACYLKSFALTVVCLVIQSAALTWYCLSYIPGGRTAVSAVFKGCFGL
jgi:hypothetical protein